MFFRHTVRPGAAPASAVAAPDAHKAIRQIWQLVLLCAGVLVVSACLLIFTALQVMRSIDHDDLQSERLRAANAIDTMTADSGPLTEGRALVLGKIAGLRDAYLAPERNSAADIQQIPLLSGQGPAGSYLVWTRTALAHDIFWTFAPIRLPIIGGMLIVVLGLMLRILHLVGDIERQRRLAHLQSRRDSLTGLANRLALDARLADLSSTGTRFAVLELDLDRFKDINDAFGHAAGDAVLREVGERLSALLGPSDLLARVGGDEFVMLLTSCGDDAALADLAHRCITAIEQPIRADDRSVTVGASIGIVPPVATPHFPAALIAMADAALYRAKSRPGSTFNFAGDRQENPAPRPARPRVSA